MSDEEKFYSIKNEDHLIIDIFDFNCIRDYNALRALINDVLNRKFDYLVIDLTKFAYLSSIEIGFILRLTKEFKANKLPSENIKLLCCAEVYDILKKLRLSMFFELLIKES